MTRDKNKIAMRGAGRMGYIISIMLLSMLLCSCFKKPVFINLNSVKIGAVKDSMLEANIDFKVYNRWGECVFMTNDKEKGWDGTYKGVPQDMGTYYYYLKYDCGGKTMEQKGDLTLIR